MNIVEGAKNRKSIRNFKPDPVPKEILEEILSLALRSPSCNNTQPWELAVVTGDTLKRICDENVSCVYNNVTPKLIYSEPFKGVFRQRQVDMAIQLFQKMGITREDKAKRSLWSERGFRYFHAPAGIIVSTDSMNRGTYAIFDLGLITQTICLAAQNYGLHTCIHTQGVCYPDVIRKHLGIADSKDIVVAISIGYPDWEFPANNIESQREPLANLTTWHGFR